MRLAGLFIGLGMGAFGLRGAATPPRALLALSKSESMPKAPDPATAKVDWVLGTGRNRTHMMFVSPDVSRMITSDVSSGTMTIIEKSAGGILMDPAASRVFVACTPDDSVAIADLTALAVMGHIPAGQPDGLAWALRQ